MPGMALMSYTDVLAACLVLGVPHPAQSTNLCIKPYAAGRNGRHHHESWQALVPQNTGEGVVSQCAQLINRYGSLNRVGYKHTHFRVCPIALELQNAAASTIRWNNHLRRGLCRPSRSPISCIRTRVQEPSSARPSHQQMAFTGDLVFSDRGCNACKGRLAIAFKPRIPRSLSSSSTTVQQHVCHVLWICRSKPTVRPSNWMAGLRSTARL